MHNETQYSKAQYQRLHIHITVTSHGRNNVSNHQQLGCCSTACSTWHFSKITKLHIIGPLWWQSTGDRGFPTQRASDAKIVPMPWRHYYLADIRHSENTHHMMTSSNGNIFRVTGPLCREFTDHRWISLTKASDADLWCFLWFAPE